MTAFPLRNDEGVAVPESQRYNPLAGQCTILGGRSHVTQGAGNYEDFGFHFQKAKRTHVSKKRGSQGEVDTNGPTWHCGPRKDYVVNPNRKDYLRGGSFANKNFSMGEAVNQIYNVTRDEDPFTGNALNATTVGNLHTAWKNDPAHFGTNPYFSIPGKAGYTPAGPAAYLAANAEYLTNDQINAFNNLNLNSYVKQKKSNAVLDGVKANMARGKQ